MSTWTTADIPSLAGKTVLITGANTGLGFETARMCAGAGATVIIACRNPQKADDAIARLRAIHADAAIEGMQLDLGSLSSVEAFSSAFHEAHDRLDVLVNNAGIMMTPLGQTEDGFEQQLGVNHLGHFALTLRLLDVLLATEGARVVNISSMGHRMGSVVVEDLMFEHGRKYSPLEAYGQSKLANLLFTAELQRRLAAAEGSAIAVAAHPGSATTDLARHVEKHWYVRIFRPVLEALLQSAEAGALPTMRALSEPGLTGNEYFGPRGFQQQRGAPVLVDRSKPAQDAALAAALWEASEKLTGLRWPADTGAPTA